MNFKLLNIIVSIQPSFGIFLLFFCFNPNLHPWQMLLLGFVLIFSLLFHEYGHALAAQKMGRPPTIVLEGFGGYTSYDGRGLSDKHHFLITLCGPLFTALIIGISYFCMKNQVFHALPLRYCLSYMMHLNIYWLIVNLAPIHPLDGGKITEYLLNKLLSKDKGRYVSLILGNVTGALGAAYFLYQGSYLFAYLFLFHGWQNFQAFKAEYTERKPSAFTRYNEALLAIKNNELQKAKKILEKLRKSKDEYIKTHSLESLAEILDCEGKGKEAYKILTKTTPEKLNRGKWLLCKLAYQEKNYQLVHKFASEIYAIQPTFETAVLNAKALAQLQHFDHSIAWLNTALQFRELEADTIEALLNDPAFVPIQHLAAFKALDSFRDC
jgi:Zn-dependent protease